MNNLSRQKRKLSVHIDVDSPLKLVEFYQIKNVNYNLALLEQFYLTSWERALDFFDRHGIKGTFFVVGDELDRSTAIQTVIRKAHQCGHEIENHTYSHPFGLAKLSETRITEEIVRCSEIIEKTTGHAPEGFRSPGYNISTAIINLLETLNFKYDSSGFWSVMNPILKLSHKFLFKNGVSNGDFGMVSSKMRQLPYFPDEEDWIRESKNGRKLLELPLPRTNFFGLPFYNNFNLWAPGFYADFATKTISRENIIYLFHIIEFMDMTDSIPDVLSVHPNLKMPVKAKIKRSEKLLAKLMERYEVLPTRELIRKIYLKKEFVI